MDDVQILTGWASPIPALVEVSGAWPGPCAQLAEIGQPVIDDFRIEISLLATAAIPDCPPDPGDLPFSIRIPLNWMQLPEGEYTVRVNGQETILHVPVVPAEPDPELGPVLGSPATPTPGAASAETDPVFPAVADPQPEAAPITVNTLVIQTGVGEPAPVHAQVIGELPSLCSQLATVRQDVQPFRFDVILLAHPGRADCPPDAMGLSFRLDIPLNVAALPQGTYTVNVNGVETTFEAPLAADPSAINPNPSGGADGSD